jgi:hypothetical protein
MASGRTIPRTAPPGPSLGLLCGLLSLYAGVGRCKDIGPRVRGIWGLLASERSRATPATPPARRCLPLRFFSGGVGAESLRGGLRRFGGNVAREPVTMCGRANLPRRLGDLGASSRRRSSSRSLWASFRSLSATSRRWRSSASSASRVDWARSGKFKPHPRRLRASRLRHKPVRELPDSTARTLRGIIRAALRDAVVTRRWRGSAIRPRFTHYPTRGPSAPRGA